MTIAELEAKVALWSSCEDRIAVHQSFVIGDKKFVYADLVEVRKTLNHYELRLEQAKANLNGKRKQRTMNFVY